MFTQDGRWVRQFGRNELRAPHYVAVGEDGRVVVTDTSQNRVRVYNGQGEPLVTFGSSGAGDPKQTANQIYPVVGVARLADARVSWSLKWFAQLMLAVLDLRTRRNWNQKIMSLDWFWHTANQ